MGNLSEQLAEFLEDFEEDGTVSDKLEAIKDAMALLVGEARELLQGDEGREIIWPRAKGYWWAHIVTALDRDHNFLGSSMFTMQDTINELREAESSSDDE